MRGSAVRFAPTTVVSCFLLISATGTVTAYSPRRIPKDAVYLNDDSDWWSPGRLNGTQPTGEEENQSEPLADKAPAQGDVDRFSVLGVRLAQHGGIAWLRDIETRLGKTTIVERGDGAAGREQLCYKSLAKSGDIKLIFEHNEIDYSLILFSGGCEWKGIEYCAESPWVTTALATPGGLNLGMTEGETESILGKPAYTKENRRWYEFEAHRFVTVLRDKPEDWVISGKLELMFSNHRLTCLAVSRSEVY